tara:strand:- start:206 stop:415 length:210 start_codon:yes stop_codon:yes gene_type:complete
MSIFNSWPGEEGATSYGGYGPESLTIDAYFTSANSESTLIFWTLVGVAILIFTTWSAARHESQTAKDTK